MDIISGTLSKQGQIINGVLSAEGLVLSGTLSSLGIRGKSAYQIACDYGFQGTEEEWIDSLKKEKIETKVDDHNVIYYKYIHEEENEWKVFFNMGTFLDDLSDLEKVVAQKVNKINGYSLVKDTEIARLTTLHNYDDSELRIIIQTIDNKVYQNDQAVKNTIAGINSTLDSIHANIETLENKFNDYRTSINQDAIDSEIKSEISALGDTLNDYKTNVENEFKNYRTSAAQDVIDNDLQDAIDENKSVIEVLNGEKTIEGSIKKQISDAISSVVNGAPTDYNTLKKISDWISTHSTEAAVKISELENYIGSLPSGTKADTIVDYIAEVCEGLINDADLNQYATIEYLNGIKEDLEDTKADKSDLVAHNSSTTAHEDIRELISGLSTRLNTLADSDDETLDQLSEIVSYIKANKDLIDLINDGKVNVADIVDDLVTENTAKPLSAKQGKLLKDLIDAIVIPTKVSELTNDSGYLTEHQNLDNYYTKEQVDDVAAKSGKVKTVNNNEPDEAGNVTVDIPEPITKVSELENDANYLTEHQDISGKADKEDLNYVIYHEDGDDDDEDIVAVNGADLNNIIKQVNIANEKASLLEENFVQLKTLTVSYYLELKALISGEAAPEDVIAILDKAILDVSKLS